MSEAIRMSEEMKQQVAALTPAASEGIEQSTTDGDPMALESPGADELEVITYQDDLADKITPLKCNWSKECCC